jgi:hypothetical protein
LVLFSVALPANAEPGYLHHYLEGEVISFLQRKAPCYASVFFTFKKGKGFREGDVYSKIFCLFDGVSGQGTIKERKGCIASTYDIETDRYLNLFKPEYQVPNPMVAAACSDEKSMEKLLDFENAYEWVVRAATGEYTPEVVRKVVFWGPGSERLRDAACKKGMKRKEFPKQLFCADK